MNTTNKFYLILAIALISLPVFSADRVISTQTKNTISANSTINSTILSQAKEWNLSESEWRQYLGLVNGRNGHYYKKLYLSPPEILGINADTPEDIRHFAEIAVQLEHEKVERELRFNTAFHAAAVRLYPNEPIIREFDLTPFTPIPKNAE